MSLVASIQPVMTGIKHLISTQNQNRRDVISCVEGLDSSPTLVCDITSVLPSRKRLFKLTAALNLPSKCELKRRWFMYIYHSLSTLFRSSVERVVRELVFIT